MKKAWVVFCCACLALVLCARASANVSFGITEDEGALNDPTLFYSTLNDLGANENRMAILWDPANPKTIPNQAALDLWVPQAAIHAVRLIFAVSPAHPRDVTASRANIAQFAAFLAQLARTYPTVKDFVVGNEPNQPRFWQPQFDAKRQPASGRAYEPLLSASYDALKAVDPTINVIGVGLSPRGNNNALAKSNASTSPTEFIHDIGVAYRASKRTKPLMDELGFHPYPYQNSDPPLKGYPWPNAGIPNLDRIKQAVWDAFNGTHQPTFAERGKAKPGHTLMLDLDETAWQVAIPTSLEADYFGNENVTPVDETTQAQYYADIIRFVSCDPNVRSLSFFHLIDEQDLDRWQSGLMRADGSKRPSYTSVKNAIAQTQGKCALTPPGWQHTTTVIGANAQFGFLSKRSARNTLWRFHATAQEGAVYRAGVFRLGSGKLTAAARKAVIRSLANARSKPLLGSKATMKVYRPTLVKLQRHGLKRSGWYVYGVRIAALMNPKRANTYVSRPFLVVGAPARR